MFVRVVTPVLGVLRICVAVLRDVTVLRGGQANAPAHERVTRYFETRTLIPFAIYWLVADAICIGRFS
jgi:hypothetical protein